MRSPMMAASPLASFSWLPRSSTGMKVESLGWLFFLSGEVRTGIQQESEWPYSSHSRVHFPVRATSGRGRESEIQEEGAIKVGHSSIGFSDLYEFEGDIHIYIFPLPNYFLFSIPCSSSTLRAVSISSPLKMSYKTIEYYRKRGVDRLISLSV